MYCWQDGTGDKVDNNNIIRDQSLCTQCTRTLAPIRKWSNSNHRDQYTGEEASSGDKWGGRGLSIDEVGERQTVGQRDKVRVLWTSEQKWKKDKLFACSFFPRARTHTHIFIGEVFTCVRQLRFSIGRIC